MFTTYLRSLSEFVLSKVLSVSLSVFHGVESVSHLSPQIRNMGPLEMKRLTAINVFKREVNKWKPETCALACI